ncbi:hypothetical protein [Bordetella sp. LUAb4]|uniref:hypothetical protein n=1 Tax=Bordetella sp. LUAb4 TaxID=2843195 RepID=UPI001E4BB117|nr:hypothetical protein [Bordetella sp. LUAb4]
MQDKIPVLVLYGVLGLLLALSPSIIRIQHAGGASVVGSPDREQWPWLPAVVFPCAILLAIYTHLSITSPLFLAFGGLSVGFGALFRSSVRDAAQVSSATMLACIISATLPWWRRQGAGLDISPGELLSFGVILASAMGALLARSSSVVAGGVERAVLLGIYVLIAAYLSYSTAAVVDPYAMIRQWHHWGAYIDPAQAVLGGARLLHDIPAQYGAGPTLMLSWVCGVDCWDAAYWVIGTATFAYALLIGAITWRVAAGSRYRNIAVLLLCVATCLLWSAYPPAVFSPNLTPSTSGMRFLPVVSLTAWVVFTPTMGFRYRVIGGHLLWILGAVWSPESLFYVTAVWWPVYVFDYATKAGASSRLLCLVNAVARLLVVAFGTIIVVCVGYYLAYGVLPVLRTFLAYALYPPGPLPINPHGAVWYFVYAMVAAVSVVRTRLRLTGDTDRFRRSLALQLLAFSTFSYYLGRSHDNNLLNLLPFLMLVLQDALVIAKGLFARQSLAIMLASLLAWVTVFGWGTWQNAYQAGTLAEFGFSATREKLSYSDPSTESDLLRRIPAVSKDQIDQERQVMDLLSARKEPFLLMDQYFLLQPHYPVGTWAAMHVATNFEFFPSALRREFLQRTADHLRRSGWVIIARSHALNTWLDDFDAVYDRTDRIDLPAVYAIRFSPKS